MSLKDLKRRSLERDRKKSFKEDLKRRSKGDLERVPKRISRARKGLGHVSAEERLEVG